MTPAANVRACRELARSSADRSLLEYLETLPDQYVCDSLYYFADAKLFEFGWTAMSSLGFVRLLGVTEQLGLTVQRNLDNRKREALEPPLRGVSHAEPTANEN